MKKFAIITLLILTFAASSQGNWFWHDDHQHEQTLEAQLQHEEQRGDQLQHQFQQEHHHNTDLNAILVLLGVGCIVTFIAGTMIGSRTRRASNEN